MTEDEDDDLFLWKRIGDPVYKFAVRTVYRRMMQRRDRKIENELRRAECQQ